ncbi:MAG: DUF1254 domain-containing protein [Thermoleophilia bacterium]|nr:DUF1254 domain-containing protein [Thermoleophilia bacterium]
MIDDRRRIEDVRADVPPAAAREAEAGNARAVAMQAYLYAFPGFLHMRQLQDFVLGRRYAAPGEPPLGGWVLMRALADPATTTVSPNVDTLSGASHLLLDDHGPVVLSVPAAGDRYLSVAVLDASFDTAGLIGPRTTGTGAGDHLIAGPGWSGEVPPGIASVVRVPTPAAALIQRIFVHGPDEYGSLHRLQDAVRVTPLARWPEGAGFPESDLSIVDGPPLRETRDPLDFFAITSRWMRRNPPPATDRGLAGLFDTVGTGPGSALPEDPGLREALRAGARDAQALIDARVVVGPTHGGWRLPDPVGGAPGRPFADRAAAQMTQLGQLPATETVYLFAQHDAAGDRLDGARRYEVAFPPGGLPPLDAPGFWSVTMNGPDSLLVANPAGRYVVRPDTPGLEPGPDGALTLVVQSPSVADAPGRCGCRPRRGIPSAWRSGSTCPAPRCWTGGGCRPRSVAWGDHALIPGPGPCGPARGSPVRRRPPRAGGRSRPRRRSRAPGRCGG